MDRKRKLLWSLWAAALVLATAALLVSPPEAETAAAPPVKGYIALTFDDGPWPESTRRLLDGLAERGVKATFFLIGSQVAGQEALVRRMADEGHQLGLHTWDHADLRGLPARSVRQQLDRTRQAVEEIIGPTDLMLRPPYGFVDESLRDCAGVPIIGWSVDTGDWKDRRVSRIVEAVEAGAEDGAIVLMHDSYDTSVTAALESVDRLMAGGYYFVTVEQLFALHGVKPEAGQVYRCGKGDAS